MESKSDRATRRTSLDWVHRDNLSEEAGKQLEAKSNVHNAEVPLLFLPGSAPEKKGAQIQHKAAGGQLQAYGR